MFIIIINLPHARLLHQNFLQESFPGKPCLSVKIAKNPVAVIFIKLFFVYNYRILIIFILSDCKLTSSSTDFEGGALCSEVDWLGGLSTSKC